MNQIIIQPKNPLDLKPEELEELAELIRSSYPQYDVLIEAGEGYSGYAVTLFEVLGIWIMAPITGKIVEQVTKLAIDWARQRFHKKNSTRGKSITIYDSQGGELKSIVIKSPMDEPEDRTDKNNIYRPKPPIKTKKRRFIIKWPL